MKKITSALRVLALCAVSLAALGMNNQAAQADGTRANSGWIYFPDYWFSQGWAGAENNGATKGAANASRSWSGTNTSFSGSGGWFSANWTPTGGSWIPDISRNGPGLSSIPLSNMVPNYNIRWTGTGNIIPNGSTYTFGLKFNLTAPKADGTPPGWVPYNHTTSYEAYIITQTNKTIAQRDGDYIGTVSTPGDPVPYDCYVANAYWDGGFKQLWAWRQENTWNGPVNVHAILKFWSDESKRTSITSFDMNTWYASNGFSIMNETFGTSGNFRVENVQIPDMNTLITTPVYRARFYPRSTFANRMNGGYFEGSNNSSGPYTRLATINGTPPEGTWSEVQLGSTPYRYLRYVSPTNSYGNIAELVFYNGSTKLSGTGFGTSGSYNNLGNTFAKALDGDTTTFFDASSATASGAYVGIDTNSPSSGDITYSFSDTPTASGDHPVDGNHGGIEFGQGLWGASPDYYGFNSRNGWFTSNVSSGSFTLPANTRLKSIKLSTHWAGTRWTISDGVNTKSDIFSAANSPITVSTAGWTGYNRQIRVTFEAGWESGIDDIVYGP